MKGFSKLIFNCLVFSICLATANAQPVTNKQVKSNNATTTDQVLLKKLYTISNTYNLVNKTFTIVGTLSVSENTDPGARVKEAPFQYVVKNNELYYKLGQIETLNSDGIYLYIDHEQKQITLSAQKKLVGSAPVPSPAAMIANIKNEHYTLTGHSERTIQFLTLTNERHITCRQITIGYDTIQRAIKNIYVRYTDPQHPADHTRQRIVITRISSWTGQANMSLHTTPAQVVYKKGGSWQTKEKFKNYDLIII